MTKKTLNSLPLLVSILIITLLGIFIVYEEPVFKGNKSTLEFIDPDSNISFDYPMDMVVEKSSNGEQGFINVIPERKVGQFDPQVIEISYRDFDSTMTLAEQAKDFLNLSSTNKFKDIRRKDFEVIQYIPTFGAGERYNFSFLRSQDKLVIVIFYQRHFDKENPLKMVDNSMYLRSYFQVINSIKPEAISR